MVEMRYYCLTCVIFTQAINKLCQHIYAQDICFSRRGVRGMVVKSGWGCWLQTTFPSALFFRIAAVTFRILSWGEDSQLAYEELFVLQMCPSVPGGHLSLPPPVKQDSLNTFFPMLVRRKSLQKSRRTNLPY
jgi:hypothetical protein